MIRKARLYRHPQIHNCLADGFCRDSVQLRAMTASDGNRSKVDIDVSLPLTYHTLPDIAYAPVAITVLGYVTPKLVISYRRAMIIFELHSVRFVCG